MYTRNTLYFFTVNIVLIILIKRWVEWEDALMNGSILYAVTDIVGLFLNQKMALSTVFHHICTAGALPLILMSDIREEGPSKGENGKIKSLKEIINVRSLIEAETNCY